MPKRYLKIQSSTARKILAEHLAETEPEYLETLKQIGQMFGQLNWVKERYSDSLYNKLKAATEKQQQTAIAEIRSKLA